MTWPDMDAGGYDAAQVAAHHELPTREDAVEVSRPRLASLRLTAEERVAIKGIGWDGDLDAMRSSSAPDAIGAPQVHSDPRD